MYYNIFLIQLNVMNPSRMISPFFSYCRQTVYKLFLYLLIDKSVHHTWHMKEIWILPLPLLYVEVLVIWFMHLCANISFCRPCSLSKCNLCNFHMLYMSIVWSIPSAHLWFTIVLYFVSNLCYIHSLKQIFIYFMWIHAYISTRQIIMQ